MVIVLVKFAIHKKFGPVSSLPEAENPPCFSAGWRRAKGCLALSAPCEASAASKGARRRPRLEGGEASRATLMCGSEGELATLSFKAMRSDEQIEICEGAKQGALSVA